MDEYIKREDALKAIKALPDVCGCSAIDRTDAVNAIMDCPVAGTHRKKVEKQLGTISINPCCRCGGKATIKELRDIECGHGDYMDYFWVECKKCGKRGAEVGFYCGDKDEHIDRAIQYWNQLTNKEQD